MLLERSVLVPHPYLGLSLLFLSICLLKKSQKFLQKADFCSIIILTT
ncbi:hypothetical protein HMPREF9389_0269 [Streptococcus sanguinis SK355]|uniref:Uncharacterized protein n=1 Tax=Streptococcus sanguinis SK355 TaxID=888816 RepID=F3UN61_STRSA|nr:hypothetical protein HMPREF9389_0269 [Streptococcus sanguinis SK355]